MPCAKKEVWLRETKDTSAVAVIERNPSGKMTVGHVPRLFSAVCSIFIHRSMASTTLTSLLLLQLAEPFLSMGHWDLGDPASASLDESTLR